MHACVSVELGTRELSARVHPSFSKCAEAGLTLAPSSRSSGQPISATRQTCTMEASPRGAECVAVVGDELDDPSVNEVSRPSSGDVSGALFDERGNSNCCGSIG